MTWSQLLGYGSGLAFVAPDLDWPALLGTAVAINLCNAFMCRVIARNAGHSPLRWFVLGLTCGVWAVAAVSVLPQRAPEQTPGREP